MARSTSPVSAPQRAAVVVKYGAGAGEQLAWAVDVLEGELELVVKDLGAFMGRMPALGGATIDGDGNVMLLLDLRELALHQLGSGCQPAIGGACGRPGRGRRVRATADPDALSTGPPGATRAARRRPRASAPRCWWSRTRWACASCSG